MIDDGGPSPGISHLSQFELTDGNLIKQFVISCLSLTTCLKHGLTDENLSALHFTIVNLILCSLL